jgi:hypothetical protein
VEDFGPETPPYPRATLPDTAVRTIVQIGAGFRADGMTSRRPQWTPELAISRIATGACLALLVPSVEVLIATPERIDLINPLHP